eukprot:1570254-Rhodomonas_salina.2
MSSRVKCDPPSRPSSNVSVPSLFPPVCSQVVFDLFHLTSPGIAGILFLSMSSPKLKEKLLKSFLVVTKVYGEALYFKGDAINAFYIIQSGTCGEFGTESGGQHFRGGKSANPVAPATTRSPEVGTVALNAAPEISRKNSMETIRRVKRNESMASMMTRTGTDKPKMKRLQVPPACCVGRGE